MLASRNGLWLSSQKKTRLSAQKSPEVLVALHDPLSDQTRLKASSLDLSLKMKMLRRGISTCLSIGLHPRLHYNIICNFCLKYLKTTCQYNIQHAKDESRKRPPKKLCDHSWDKARYAKHQSQYKRDRMNKIVALFHLTELWNHKDLEYSDASHMPGTTAKNATSPLASISLANKFDQAKTKTNTMTNLDIPAPPTEDSVGYFTQDTV